MTCCTFQLIVSCVFCNSPLLTDVFFLSLLRVEMAITADGSLVFAVIFLTVRCIDFVKPLINLRQKLDRSCCHSKASLDHPVISPAVPLTQEGLFRESVQSGAVRCYLVVFY